MHFGDNEGLLTEAEAGLTFLKVIVLQRRKWLFRSPTFSGDSETAVSAYAEVIGSCGPSGTNFWSDVSETASIEERLRWKEDELNFRTNASVPIFRSRADARQAATSLQLEI